MAVIFGPAFYEFIYTVYYIGKVFSDSSTMVSKVYNHIKKKILFRRGKSNTEAICIVENF